MNIVFYCQSCGARFEVAPASGGKTGRCKHCGQMMTIPKADELASMVALPALAPGAVGAAAGAKGAATRPAAREAPAGDSLDWLKAARSNVALAPLSVDGLPVGRPGKPRYDDDLGDSKPYALAAQPSRPGTWRPSSRPASGARMLWREELGHVQRFFRKLNEWAYLISVPFLLLVVLGAILGSRPLALTGATAVVLLEIGRIISGVANLAVVPFREGISRGILFLIPPLTFFYLASRWDRVRKPTLRIVGPIATIAAVFLAFLLVPTLRKDRKMVRVGDLKQEIRDGARELEGEMIDQVRGAKKLDVEGLGKRAAEGLREAAGKLNSIGQPDGTGSSSRP